MYYVYFLFLENGDVYTGSTDDLKRRLSEHKSGKVSSTRNRNPMLVAYEAYIIKSDALRREKFLKTTEGKRLGGLQLKDCLEKFKGNHVGRNEVRPIIR